VVLQRKFFVKSDFTVEKMKHQQAINPNTWFKFFQQKKEVTFDVRLFQKMFDFFWCWVKKFELTTCKDLDPVREAISKLNKNIAIRNQFKKKKEAEINEEKLLLYVSLSQQKPLKCYVPTMLKRAQYYNVLKRLKAIGLKDFNPDFSVAKPGFGYMDYKHNFSSYHKRSL